MPTFDQEALSKRLESRLEKIEDKLDKHLEIVATNRADLHWVKGYIKIGLSAIMAIILGLITTVFKVFYKI